MSRSLISRRACSAAIWLWRRRPIVLRRTHDRLVTENFTLRGALSNANTELRNLRRLVAGLREGDQLMFQAIERALKEPRA